MEQGNKPVVGGGSSIVGSGRDQLAEALEDVFGGEGHPVALAWQFEADVLLLRKVTNKNPVPEGWQILQFVHGPGGFADRGIRWLATRKADTWKLNFSDRRPDEARLTPL